MIKQYAFVKAENRNDIDFSQLLVDSYDTARKNNIGQTETEFIIKWSEGEYEPMIVSDLRAIGALIQYNGKDTFDNSEVLSIISNLPWTNPNID